MDVAGQDGYFVGPDLHAHGFPTTVTVFGSRTGAALSNMEGEREGGGGGV